MMRKILIAVLTLYSLNLFAGVRAISELEIVTRRNPYNVLAYGTPNDTASGDASVGIQAALDSAEAQCGGGVIYFPPGEYLIENTIIPYSQQTLQGSGMDLTILYAKTDTCIRLGDGSASKGAGTADLVSTVLEDFSVYCTDSTNYGDGIGIHYFNCWFSRATGIRVSNYKNGGQGIVYEGSSDGNTSCLANRLEYSYFSGNSTTLLFTGTGDSMSSADSHVVLGCNISQSQLENATAVHIKRGFGNIFIRVTVTSSGSRAGSVGFFIDDYPESEYPYVSRYNFFYDCYAENPRLGLVMSPNVVGTFFQGNLWQSPGAKTDSLMKAVVDSSYGRGDHDINILGAGVSTAQGWGVAHRRNIQSANLAFNGGFEIWNAGGDTVPTGWTFSDGGANATATRDSTDEKEGTWCLKIKGGTASAVVYRSIPDWEYYVGRTISLGCWVKAPNANIAQIRLGDGGTTPNAHSANHRGSQDNNGGWVYLTCKKTICSDATQLIVFLYALTAGDSAYYDGLTLVDNRQPAIYTPLNLQPFSDHTGIGGITDAFTGLATSDTLVIPGVTSNSIFMPSFKTAAPDSAENPTWSLGDSDSVFIHRERAVTNNLPYSVMWIQ